MTETDALILIAELAVGLIAAAGIVTAVGGRERDYTLIDRMRIISLVTFAAIPLATSLFSIVLITGTIQPPLLWSLASCAQILMMVAHTAWGQRKAREFASDTKSRVSRTNVAVLMALSLVCLSLLLYNAFLLGAFWPVVGVCSYYILVSVWLVLRLVLEST